MPLSSDRILKVRRPIKRVVVVPVESTPPENASGAEAENAADTAAETTQYEDLIQMSQSEFQQELDFAYQKGLEEGKLLGYRHAEAEISHTMQTLSRMIEEIQARQNEFFSRTENYLLELVFRISERIVGAISEVHRDLIRETIRKVLQISQLSGKIKIVVHPDDLKVVQDLEPELRRGFPDLKELGFVADSTIHPGGCVVETDLGKLDARIETQFTELVDRLKKTYEKL
ncbi:MAG: hypothetical protein GXO78_03610 [Calditrichaeota bacterium]|nr:hypothetical protein [Calditrichota bacterium]